MYYHGLTADSYSIIRIRNFRSKQDDIKTRFALYLPSL